MKDDKSFVPDLIGLLNDANSRVVRAARAALKSVARRDFGPDADASRAERDESIRRWREWWSQHGGG